MSSRQLTENQFRVLARGQNYALPHSNKDVYEFVAVTDNIVDSLENTSRESKSEIKSQIQTAIKSVKRERNLQPGERSALKDLQDDDSIKVVPADKGNSLVVIDSEEYSEKCNEHLSNDDIYTKLENNPMETLK